MGVMKHIASDPVLYRQYAARFGGRCEDEKMCEFCGKVIQGDTECPCNLEVQENVDESGRS